MNMTKETVQFRCKSCNNVMHASTSTPVLHCPYCDSSELIIESDNVTIERIKNDTEMEKLRQTTAIEHEKIVLDDKKDQRKNKAEKLWFLFPIIFFVLFFVFVLLLVNPDLLNISEWFAKKISCPLTAYECEKEHYSNVVMYFEDAGFTDVTAKSVTPSDDNEEKHKPGYVYKVMIDGDSNFFTSDKYRVESKIVIYYYPVE